VPHESDISAFWGGLPRLSSRSRCGSSTLQCCAARTAVHGFAWYHVQQTHAERHWFRNPLALSVPGAGHTTAAHHRCIRSCCGASFLGATSGRAHQVAGCNPRRRNCHRGVRARAPTRRPPVGLFAGVLAAIYPPLWLNDAEGSCPKGCRATDRALLLRVLRLRTAPGVWTRGRVRRGVGWPRSLAPRPSCSSAFRRAGCGSAVSPSVSPCSASRGCERLGWRHGWRATC